MAVANMDSLIRKIGSLKQSDENSLKNKGPLSGGHHFPKTPNERTTSLRPTLTPSSHLSQELRSFVAGKNICEI